MTATILELRKVSKSYGLVKAVDSVSLSLARGEFLSLLGPSGSGKTTTLQMIAGLASATGGEILLDGKSINMLPPYKRDIGVIFQNYALFPHLTVAQNIAFPLEMRGVSRNSIADRVFKALQLVDLASFGNRYPRELSGGQQQRVALARAFVFEPKILLMDEPLGALDKKLREYMQVEIKRLHERLGATIIYVTHDQEEALVMSDRIAVFNAGKIEQIAAPAEIYNRPKTRFVAEFVGETNIISASYERTKDNVQSFRSNALEIRIQGSVPIRKSRIQVCIRPERIRIGPVCPQSGHNQINGTVREVIYLGKTIKYLIKSADDSINLIIIKQVSSSIEQAFKKGDAVTATWDDFDVTLIEEGI